MNQPIRGVSAKSGALWLSVIASLLLGASAFTLLRVRGVIEDFAESRIKAEVEQVVEKFAIIDSLLDGWLLRALDRLRSSPWPMASPLWMSLNRSLFVEEWVTFSAYPPVPVPLRFHLSLKH